MKNKKGSAMSVQRKTGQIHTKKFAGVGGGGGGGRR